MGRVGLVQLDGKLPNLALMRLAAYHRRQGDEVTFPYDGRKVDKLFVSAIFTKSRPLAEWWANLGATVGGTGWDLATVLPPEVETCPPDYSLYPAVDYSLGFASRGCPRHCRFCVVPAKEGGIRSVASIADLVRPDRGGAGHMLVLLDNNFLANPDRDARFAELERLDLAVNFNQGLDIRLVDEDVAARLARLKITSIHGRPTIHFAFDSPVLEPIVRRGVAILKAGGIAPWRLTFYVLVGFDTTFEEDLHRVQVLVELGVDPYVMLHNDTGDSRLRHLERWINGHIFRSCSFDDYRPWVRERARGRLFEEVAL